MSTSVSCGMLAAWLAGGSAHLVLDVRKAPAYDAADCMLPGASWRDPAAVGSWSARLSPARPVVVYCVHGHEVSRTVAAELRRRGFAARFLAGGIEEWIATGGPMQRKPRAGGITP